MCKNENHRKNEQHQLWQEARAIAQPQAEQMQVIDYNSILKLD
jgi:hypothetical protein